MWEYIFSSPCCSLQKSQNFYIPPKHSYNLTNMKCVHGHRVSYPQNPGVCSHFFYKTLYIKKELHLSEKWQNCPNACFWLPLTITKGSSSQQQDQELGSVWQATNRNLCQVEMMMKLFRICRIWSIVWYFLDIIKSGSQTLDASL